MKTVIANRRCAEKSDLLRTGRQGFNEVACCFDSAAQENLLSLRCPSAEDGSTGKVDDYIMFRHGLLPFSFRGWIAHEIGETRHFQFRAAESLRKDGHRVTL